MENRVSDKQIVGMFLLACLAAVIIMLTVAGIILAFSAGARHSEEKQFQQDVRHMQQLGGLENYRKFKETTCNP